MKQEIKVNGLSVLLLRIMLSGIFITAGIAHVLKPDQITQRIGNAKYAQFASFMGDPYLLSLLTGFVLLLFGIAFLLGVYTRWAALVLFLVLIPITITIQLGNGIAHGPLWKNIAIFGGLLFFILSDPKVYNLYNK